MVLTESLFEPLEAGDHKASLASLSPYLYLFRHLEVNHSILKEISLEHLLEGLMLKPKLQYFHHLMQRTDSLEKTLILGMIEDRKLR